MKRFSIAAIACFALIVGVSPAAADDGLGGLLGTGAHVIQQNLNTAGDALASNGNTTGQSNGQSQIGSGGAASSGDASGAGATSGDATGGDVDQSQSASNQNDTSQTAEATSEATQVAPLNVAVPVCIALSCSTGDVEQTNANSSGDATASNENATLQANEQGQDATGGDASTGDATTGGACCGSGGDATSGDATGGDVDQSQSASNENDTTQSARAVTEAKQLEPVNRAGAAGARQSNTNRSGDATAWNGNWTGQSNGQSQTAAGGDASTGDATGGGCCKEQQKPQCGSKCRSGKPKPPPKPECDSSPRSGEARSGDAQGGDVAQHQQAGNDNRTGQSAGASTVATQERPANQATGPAGLEPRHAPCPPASCRPAPCPPAPCRPAPCPPSPCGVG